MEKLQKKIEPKILHDNAPVESNDYEIEAQVLDAQIKKDSVFNIGVIGSYGAGKSSVIKTYLKRYRKKSFFSPNHVQISLADFNKEETTSSDADNYSENAIERSILQQLLYSQKKYKLPKSSLHRTNKSNIFTILGFSLISIICLLSFIVFSFEVGGNSLLSGLNYKSNIIYDGNIVKIVSACIAIVLFVVLVICLAYAGILKKVKYKDLEISVDKNGNVPKDYSLFNNFTNEVLYFFECINVDLVIFEDLDRLENSKIFVKLRELNTIINNSPKRAKKVTFIYAVNDVLFKDENQRAKFFEFILPIVPIINPNTTYDSIIQIHKKLVKFDNALKLSEQFIKDISFFVSDMRVLKNTFNDYVVMAKKLSDNNEQRLVVKCENLFALALYKNLYPYDYARLQNNEGLIPLCVDKDRLVTSFIANEDKKIKELEANKKSIEDEYIKDFNDLKLIFKGQHISYNYTSNAGPLSDVDSINSFEGLKMLKHPNYTGYSGYAVQIHNLPTGESYFEREKIIKGKTNNRIDEIENAIKVCKANINNFESSTYFELLNKMGVENYFSEENLSDIKKKYKGLIANTIFSKNSKENQTTDNKDDRLDAQISLIRMLIYKNYLDENYLEYISNYRSDLSLRDKEFIINVKKGHIKTFNYKLDNVEEIIRQLNEEDFLQPAVLIGRICSSLEIVRTIDNESSVKTNKYRNIMKLLSTGGDSTVKAVTEFLAVASANDKFEFAQHITQSCPNLIEILFSKDINKSDKDLFIKALIKHKKHDTLKSKNIIDYINNHEEYLVLFDGLDFAAVCELIDKINCSFSKLDLSNGRNEIYEYIVSKGNYALTVFNLKSILNIDDSKISEFEQKNYTYIQNCDNARLIEKVNNNINSYLNDVFVKLPNTEEFEETIKTFLLNETIDEDVKNKIINHTNIKITDISDVNGALYESLLLSNKIVASWENIETVIDNIDYGELIESFITNNEGNISGSFSDMEEAHQTELFDSLIKSKFDEEVFKNIARSIDCAFSLNSTYAANKNCEQFILAGCFEYNVQDMQFLKNTSNKFPYYICHQDKIIKEMAKFFAGFTFVESFGRRIIEEPCLSVDFKKEFWYVCGGKTDIKEMELQVAEFLINNNCMIPEELLYKFTDVNLGTPLKSSLLSLAVLQNQITNLSSYKEYFKSMGKEYSNLWAETQRATIQDTKENRVIADFMRDNKLVNYTPRKGTLYLRCI